MSTDNVTPIRPAVQPGAGPAAISRGQQQLRQIYWNAARDLISESRRQRAQGNIEFADSLLQSGRSNRGIALADDPAEELRRAGREQLGMTSEIEEKFAQAAKMIRVATGLVDEAFQQAAENSDTENRCEEALGNLKEALNLVTWEPPQVDSPAD